MKQRKVIYLTGTTLAALALSFGQARADDQSSPTAQQPANASQSATNQTASQSQGSAAGQSGGSYSASPSAGVSQSSSAQSDMSDSSSLPGSQASFSASQGSSGQGVRVASEAETKNTAEKLSGQKLRGQDGKDVGTIKDFLVDSRSGQIRYAVVSSGGFFGLGERLRLVPYEMLQAQPNGEGFTTAVTKQQLDSAPTVDNKELDSARVTLDAQQQQQTQQALGSSDGNAGGMTSSASTGFASADAQSQGSEFVRASKIKDSEVQANGSKIGSIENIVIEQGGGEAMALVTPEANIGSDDQKFLVPLSQIQVAAGEKHVTTNLSQTDFEAAAQASSGGAAAGGMAADTSASDSSATVATSDVPASATSQDSSAASTAGTTGSSTTATSSGTLASADTASADANASTNANASAPTATGSQSGFASDAATQYQQSDTAAWSAATPAGVASTEQSQDISAATSGQVSTPAQTSSVSENAAVASSTAPSPEQGNETRTSREGTEPAIAGVYGDMNSVHEDENDPVARPAPGVRPAQSTQGGDPVNAGEGSTPSGYAATTDVASTPEGRVNNDDSTLTPTGATSADQSPNAKPELVSAAQQIRQALDQNEQLSGQNVQVKPEGEKIVLRGSVSSDALKDQVEDLAKGSANDVEVDNQIEVKQR